MERYYFHSHTFPSAIPSSKFASYSNTPTSLPVEDVRQNTDPRSVLLLLDTCAMPCPVHVAISDPPFVMRTPCPSAYSIVPSILEDSLGRSNIVTVSVIVAPPLKLPFCEIVVSIFGMYILL
jgi:hypothetical protein